MSGLVTRSLLAGYQRLARPLMFTSDPERIHEQTIAGLAKLPATDSATEVAAKTIAGIRFPNPVGVAAGLDKDGLAAAAWTRLGFGFAELGTVTAAAQPGNDRPRLVRLPQSQAIINRMGFNNAGAHELAFRLISRGVRRGNYRFGIPLGISIGKTKVVPLEEATADYVVSAAALRPVADYLAINISSPNTPGLRSLQTVEHTHQLVASVVKTADPVPVFVKFSPDLGERDLADLVAAAVQSGASGIIATNTTLGRAGIAPTESDLAEQHGGLSGRPLTLKSREFVAKLRMLTDLPIIGVGGIMTPADAAEMFAAGADLIQLYTGFIYAGPALTHGIADQLRSTS